MTPIRSKLTGSRITFGTWLSIGSSQSAEIVGRAGFDWVIVDTQHGGISEAGLLPILQALDLTQTPALVRVPWLDPALIMRALDLGATGVVVPMVNTADDALTAVRAARYPPAGVRSFGRVRSYHKADGSAEDPLCLVMIETVEALANVEAIAATPGIDGLLVGPVDLALSMGLGPAFRMPDAVLHAVERVAAACRAHGRIAASVSLGPDNARQQIERGMTFLTSGADALFLKLAAQDALANLRRIADEAG